MCDQKYQQSQRLVILQGELAGLIRLLINIEKGKVWIEEGGAQISLWKRSPHYVLYRYSHYNKRQV